jgi:hydrogenase maturation protease
VNADGVVVVGYGNTLRGDDAVGPRVAEMLTAGDLLPGARIIARHQLTPELAADIIAARLVVLVDARANGGTPCEVHVERVVGGSHPGGSHAFDPSSLVDLVAHLYGRSPPVILVSVSAGQYELGADLSPAVAAKLPHVLDTIVAAVDQTLVVPAPTA